MPNLGRYKIIRAPCKVLIPSEKRQKTHKLAPKTEPGRLLAVLSLKTFLIWVPAKRIIVKTPFIKLKEKALLRNKTAIPRDLSAEERELINLVTNNDSDNDLGKDATPEKSINSPIISNSNSNPEPSEINHHGANLEAKFGESNFAKQITNLIPKAPNEQHQSINTSLNWLWPEQINPSEPANCYFNNNLAVASESKKKEGANSKGEAIEITSLIRNINYKATKKQTKRPIRKKGRYGKPQSLTKALKSPLSRQWLKAISNELTQLLEFGTFKFLPKSKLPKGRKALTNRVVYRQKINKKGKITKLKARLVVRGFLQVKGINYINTFTSTTIPSTWRILLILAAINDWEIEQIDFIRAFLNGDLKKDIYIEIPPELIKLTAKDPKFTNLAAKCGFNINSAEGQIIHLKKALYGLKQSPRVWQTKLQNLLKDLGYQPLASDSAVYINPKKRLFIITFVDDYIIISPNKKNIRALKE